MSVKKIDIALHKNRKGGCVASLEADGETIKLAEMGTVSATCAAAATVLFELTERFRHLSIEGEPFKEITQKRINRCKR